MYYFQQSNNEAHTFNIPSFSNPEFMMSNVGVPSSRDLKFHMPSNWPPCELVHGRSNNRSLFAVQPTIPLLWPDSKSMQLSRCLASQLAAKILYHLYHSIYIITSSQSNNIRQAIAVFWISILDEICCMVCVQNLGRVKWLALTILVSSVG